MGSRPASCASRASSTWRTARSLGLLRNVEEREAKAHTLKRIMSVEEQGETVTVNTTHPGLARSLGDALHHAYGGALDYHYPEEGTSCASAGPADRPLRVDLERNLPS